MKLVSFLSSFSFRQASLYLLGCIVFTIGGCSQPLYWAKPGAQAGDFEKDAVECREELGLPSNPRAMRGFSILNPSVGTASAAMEQCLADKGWYLARKPKE